MVKKTDTKNRQHRLFLLGLGGGGVMQGNVKSTRFENELNSYIAQNVLDCRGQCEGSRTRFSTSWVRLSFCGRSQGARPTSRAQLGAS